VSNFTEESIMFQRKFKTIVLLAVSTQCLGLALLVACGTKSTQAPGNTPIEKKNSNEIKEKEKTPGVGKPSTTTSQLEEICKEFDN
jgi:hypothetical protein